MPSDCALHSIWMILRVRLPRQPKYDISRPARKPTLCPLHNVSTQISLRNPRRLFRADTFRLRRNVSVRVSLRGMLWLIRVDTLRNVGFLTGRFILFNFGFLRIIECQWKDDYQCIIALWQRLQLNLRYHTKYLGSLNSVIHTHRIDFIKKYPLHALQKWYRKSCYKYYL